MKKKTYPVVKYSEMESQLVLIKALQNLRNALIPKNSATDEEKEKLYNELRYLLSQKQDAELKTADSLLELQKSALLLHGKKISI